MLGGDAQRALLARPPDEDRRATRPDGRGLVDGVLHPVVLALEGGPLVPEHRLDDLEGLLEPVESLAERPEVEPERVCSSSNHPAPMPRIARPLTRRRGR